LTDKFRALQMFFVGVLTGQPPELIFPVIRSYWRNGLPTQNELSKSHPSLSRDEVIDILDALGVLDQFLRGLDEISENTLVVDVPEGVSPIICQFCEHQFEVTAEELSDLEATMSLSGCPQCGQLHSRGRWFEE